MDIAGYVSKQMLKHYSHIRMEAKRNALETVIQKRAVSTTEENRSQEHAESPVITQVFEGEYPQKSPQSGVFEGHRGACRRRKSLKLIGSPGRTRTYNPSIDSRMHLTTPKSCGHRHLIGLMCFNGVRIGKGN